MLEKLETLFVINEKYVLDPWQMKIKPALKKHKYDILGGALLCTGIAGSAFLGATLAIKNAKIDVNLWLNDGTKIPIPETPNLFK